MNTVTFGVLIAALGVSCLDWVAVVRRNKPIEYVCKPAAAALFFVAALTLDPVDDTARVWMAIALVFCIAGDVFLMLPRDAFVPGLASFAIAQILLTVSFAIRETSTIRLLIGFAVVLAVLFALARRFIGALANGDQRGLIPPIVVYMTVISAMVVSSIASGSVWGILGAVLFMASDSLIAEQRFVREQRWQPVTVIVTYHLALAGLVSGLI